LQEDLIWRKTKEKQRNEERDQIISSTCRSSYSAAGFQLVVPDDPSSPGKNEA